ncbi:FAD-binding oxidoreductase [Sulfitobacter sp. LCG007]
MKHIFGDYAYGGGPRAGCWWDETCTLPERPALTGTRKCDVAIIGGGFTGISAALHLAEGGARVIVLEAEHVGWGASGRNGGFCCLGGSKASDAYIDRHFGREARLEWHRAEKTAVELVDALTRRFGIDVDRHSNGETMLAHRMRDMAEFESTARAIEENYGVTAEVHTRRDLEGLGMAGPFKGALSTPIGFGLNPRKYIAGLAAAAEAQGAQICDRSPVARIETTAGGFRLHSGAAQVEASQVVVATNGYSSEDLPGWLAGRYIPAQSTVLVTRPLEEAELQAAGWTSDQMAFDTRTLLHYFRLMPDRRFLFGMRGGLRTGAGAETAARAAVLRDFRAMFPAWSHVETPHSWSGFVGLARDMMPFVGEVPGTPGLWAGLCYHGNGVAMASFSGALLAKLVGGAEPDLYPAPMRKPLSRFPLGRARRIIMPAAYVGFALSDL